MSEANLEANHNSPALSPSGPPKSKLPVTKRVAEWLRANLFSSWFNTLLTFVSLLVTYFILKATLEFVFITAQWSVIGANFKLLMVGQFPVDQLWRVWAGVTLLITLLGLSWGLWRGTIGHVAISFGVILAIVAALPFIHAESRVWLVVNIVLLIGMYALGRGLTKFKKIRITTIVLWCLFFPVVIFILNGLGVLNPVNPNLWGGFLLTVLIAMVAIVCSFPLALLLALGRRSKLPAIKWFCIAYIELVRGIPLITILFVAQLMLPLFLGSGLELSNVLRAMIGFTLFSAAYQAENIRGGLQSIPRGQFEAAQALGLNVTLMNIFIIVPQALRAVIPAIVGLCIAVFEDTSLVAAVSLTDILGMAKRIVANPEFLGLQMEAYLFVSFVFFIFCSIMSRVSRRLETALGVGKR